MWLTSHVTEALNRKGHRKMKECYHCLKVIKNITENVKKKIKGINIQNRLQKSVEQSPKNCLNIRTVKRAGLGTWALLQSNFELVTGQRKKNVPHTFFSSLHRKENWGA